MGHQTSRMMQSFVEKLIISIHRRDRCFLGQSIKANGICVPGTRKFFIDIHGDIYPCERVATAYNLGNVNRPFAEARIVQVVEDYISESEKDCSRCWAARLCQLCFSNAIKANRFSIDKKRIMCNSHRKSLEEALEIYVSVLEKNGKAYDFVDTMEIV
jgi:uncharacterized protein